MSRVIESVVGRRLITLAEATSTNDVAFQLGGDGTVVVADTQTAGRGRHGRIWQSAPRLGLWCSIVLDGPSDYLTFAAALAVQSSLSTRTSGVTIKWPNDILVAGKKVCGILVEHRNAVSVIGIGLNVNHRMSDFPVFLQATATSLALATGHDHDQQAILDDVLYHLDAHIQTIRAGQGRTVFDMWANACVPVGARIQSGSVSGRVLKAESSGALRVVDEHGTEHIITGEIES